MDAPTWTERPAVRWGLLAVGIIVLVHGAAYLLLLNLQRAHAGEVLRGVVVDAQPVGGFDREQLEDTVQRRSQRVLAQPLHVATEERPEEDPPEEEVLRVEADRETVGVRAHTDLAVEEAWRRGRRGLYRGLADHLRARAGATLEVELPREVDEGRLRTWSSEAAEALSRAPQPAGIAFVVVDAPDDVEVETSDPVTGATVAAEVVAEAVLETLPRTGPLLLEVPAELEEAPTTEADVAAAVERARRAVSAPVTLRSPEAEDLELAPADLAQVIAVEHDPQAEEGERLRLTTSAELLEEHLGDEGVAALQAEAVEATFRVEGEEVEIEGGTRGYEVDLDASAQRVLELAARERPREGELVGEETSPDLTLEDAEELGVEEEVASFSTDLVPGESRNVNIHLAADFLDGALILPDERFSLNEAIGPRTEERGFVENGFIDAEGEMTDVVGGGVSQLGTTFLNAVWATGIQVDEFQPHSYYFERYPMGREATLVHGAVDVVVTNDSPHGLLIVTEHTDSSVTIRVFSSDWAEVDSWTDDPTDRVSGGERDGFQVRFGRDITYPDGESRSEEYDHRYDPED
jgi:vancomycin resistance protein YoaR